MYVIGNLIVEDESFSILSYELRFNQVRSMFGQPTGRVNGGLIEVTIEAHVDRIFHRWAMTTEMMKDAEIIFSPVTRTGKSRKIQLYDVFCASLEVNFDNYTSSPMTFTLLLSPGIFKDGDAILKKPWHVTNLDVVNSNAPVSRDPLNTPPSVRHYLTDTEEKRINDYTVNSQIIVHIKSKNMQNREISIQIPDKDYDFIHEGQTLTNDTLTLTITDDAMQVELEVIASDQTKQL